MEAQPGLRAMLTTPEEDDEEEHFSDAPEDDENGDVNDKEEKKIDKPKSTRIEYDGRKRDPRFSNAEKSCLWELVNKPTRHLIEHDIDITFFFFK